VQSVNDGQGLGAGRGGKKECVVRPAMATPKLMAICCVVLAMELALLVWASVVSAKASVFMLVYCSEEKRSICEGEKNNEPDRGVDSDGGEGGDDEADDNGVGDEHAAVTDEIEQALENHFHAQRSQGLGHDEAGRTEWRCIRGQS